MKIDKLPSGNYNVRKQVNGRRISITFDHKPSRVEIIKALSRVVDDATEKSSFKSCAESYINSKSNVLSPSTVRLYLSYINSIIDEDFLNRRIDRITQQDIQFFVNDFAVEHSPKTVRNVHGFISAVLRQFRPNMNIYTTLPQKRLYEPYTPSEEDIKRILDASKDDKRYHVCFQLGIMGLRRSEICALSPSDIQGNTLIIDKALVKDKDKNWVIKTTKTTAGTRKIYIPDSLVAEIEQNGYVFNGYPNKMLDALKRYQDKLGIPRFRFHDLRHFFASYAHEKGIMSEQTIMETGGWKSVETLRSRYRHGMNVQNSQKELFDGLLKNEQG